MLKRKIIAVLLCFCIVFSMSFFADAPKAKANWPVFDPTNYAVAYKTLKTAISEYKDKIAKYIMDNMNAVTITASKMAALWAVQRITQQIIGEGSVISDWNEYLIIAPQQRAMMQMNSFFETASRGRSSRANYEGVGPNYDSYLIGVAKKSITGQAFVTNLQETTTSPNQLFATGNAKGVMEYMQCANNPACYSLVAQEQYDEKLAREKKIAEMAQKDGFKPTMRNGVIIRPAAIAASALSQMDQLGTQVIMNADSKEGVAAGEMQIAQGAAMNIAARTLNYSIADGAGRAAIQNRNDQFPFSLGYTSVGGVGVTSNGGSGRTATSNSGVGAVNPAVQIGNTCATAGLRVQPDGGIIAINGQKVYCASGSLPVSDLNTSRNVCSGTTGDATCVGYFGSAYKCGATGKCVRR